MFLNVLMSSCSWAVMTKYFQNCHLFFYSSGISITNNPWIYIATYCTAYLDSNRILQTFLQALVMFFLALEHLDAFWRYTLQNPKLWKHKTNGMPLLHIIHRRLGFHLNHYQLMAIKAFVALCVNYSNQFNECEYSFILILDWCSASKRNMNWVENSKRNS